MQGGDVLGLVGRVRAGWAPKSLPVRVRLKGPCEGRVCPWPRVGDVDLGPMLGDAALVSLPLAGAPSMILVWMMGGIDTAPTPGAVNVEEELARRGHSLGCHLASPVHADPRRDTVLSAALSPPAALPHHSRHVSVCAGSDGCSAAALGLSRRARTRRAALTCSGLRGWHPGLARQRGARCQRAPSGAGVLQAGVPRGWVDCCVPSCLQPSVGLSPGEQPGSLHCRKTGPAFSPWRDGARFLTLQTCCTPNHHPPQQSPATLLARQHRQVQTGAGAPR